MAKNIQQTDIVEQVRTVTARAIAELQHNSSDSPISPQEVAKRLGFAVNSAGGSKAIAARTGIPLRTLHEHLSGRSIKTETAVVLADVCGVTLEWLLAARGPMKPGAAPKASEPQISAPLAPPPPPPFSGINVDQLAKALQAAAAAFQSKGTTPSMHQLAQVTALLYGDDTSA